jgi:hypothetical protein
MTKGPIWQPISDSSIIYLLQRRVTTLLRVFSYYSGLHDDYSHYQGSHVAFQYESSLLSERKKALKARKRQQMTKESQEIADAEEGRAKDEGELTKDMVVNLKEFFCCLVDANVTTQMDDNEEAYHHVQRHHGFNIGSYAMGCYLANKKLLERRQKSHNKRIQNGTEQGGNGRAKLVGSQSKQGQNMIASAVDALDTSGGMAPSYIHDEATDLPSDDDELGTVHYTHYTLHSPYTHYTLHDRYFQKGRPAPARCRQGQGPTRATGGQVFFELGRRRTDEAYSADKASSGQEANPSEKGSGDGVNDVPDLDQPETLATHAKTHRDRSQRPATQPEARKGREEEGG